MYHITADLNIEVARRPCCNPAHVVLVAAGLLARGRHIRLHKVPRLESSHSLAAHQIPARKPILAQSCPLIAAAPAALHLQGESSRSLEDSHAANAGEISWVWARAWLLGTSRRLRLYFVCPPDATSTGRPVAFSAWASVKRPGNPQTLAGDNQPVPASAYCGDTLSINDVSLNVKNSALVVLIDAHTPGTGVEAGPKPQAMQRARSKSATRETPRYNDARSLMVGEFIHGPFL